MSAPSIERDLLFAARALRWRHIPMKRLLDGWRCWSKGRRGPFSEFLVTQGLLTQEAKDAVVREITGILSSELGSTIEIDTTSLTKALKSVDDPDFAEVFEDLLRQFDALEDRPQDDSRIAQVRYALTGLHGEGSLGRIWVARDKVLNRDVALKEIKPQYADLAAARSRFLREAQIAGQLEHPNIVEVHELGYDRQSDRPFCAMRLVRGRTLGEAIREHHSGEATDELVFRRLLQDFVSVCQAMAYAHSRGVVHRDLKPDNVVLGEYGEVSVLDWGLAKRIDARENDGETLPVDLSADADADRTVAGRILGTPAYMAPEQADGRVEQIDARTDIFGLGAMLFHILTGRAPNGPLEGETRVAFVTRIATDPPPRASSVAASVPRPLDAVCARAMARDPAARYACAADLANDVQRWLAGEAVAVYQEPWSQQLSRWLVRRRVFAQAAATLVLVLLTTVASLTTHVWESRRLLARVETDNLRREAEVQRTRIISEIGDIGERARFVALSAPVRDLIRSHRVRDFQNEATAQSQIAATAGWLMRADPGFAALSVFGGENGVSEILRVVRDASHGIGVRLVSGTEALGAADADFVQQALEVASGGTFVSLGGADRTIDAQGDRRIVPLRVGVRVASERNDRAVGFVLLNQMLNHERDPMPLIAHAPGSELYLTDDRGEILLGPGGNEPGAPSSWIQDVMPVLKDFLTAAGASELSLSSAGPGHDAVYATKIRFDPADSSRYVCLVMRTPYERLRETVGLVAWLLLFVAALFVAVAALSAYFFTRVLGRSSRR